jgi:hypothetical protein
MGQHMEKVTVFGATVYRCRVCTRTDTNLNVLRGHVGTHFFDHSNRNELAVRGVLGRTPLDPIAAAQKDVTRKLGSQVNRLDKQNKVLKAEIRQLRKERTQLMRALRKGRAAA